MKLKHPDYEFEVSFEDGKSTMLVIENPVLLRSVLMDLFKVHAQFCWNLE